MKIVFQYPVNTRRYLEIYSTFFKCCMDVKTTVCFLGTTLLLDLQDKKCRAEVVKTTNRFSSLAIIKTSHRKLFKNVK